MLFRSLSEAAGDLRENDRLHLFEFDNSAHDLGTTQGPGWRTLIRQLNPPQGGTEIGNALAHVMAATPARDILLLSDGKSYALDVQTLARSGRRFTVVLIGEDSLEANIGHLAALTGGDILIPDRADVAGAVRSAFQAIRYAGEPGAAAMRRGGMTVAARHGGPAGGEAVDHEYSRAVGAYAACLSLPLLPVADARKLAEAEGLVTHLTSLILVDEDGTTTRGLPATRKVALPTPATWGGSGIRLYCTAISGGGGGRGDSTVAVERQHSIGRKRYAPSRTLGPEDARRRESALRAAASATPQSAPPSGPDAAIPATAKPFADLSKLAAGIDWAVHAEGLVKGELQSLDAALATLIAQAAGLALLRKAAKRLGLSPLALVIGLLARAAASRDRHASRVYRAILGHANPRDLAHSAERLGLDLRA